MIKIDKDKYPPEVRFTQANHPYKGQLKWRVALKRTLSDFMSDPTPFNNGDYKFSYDYGYDQFRAALEQNQGPKCCFCEKAVEGGNIEHFRPKKAWQQVRGTPYNRPGYYWLAYSWSNFLISCGECNSQSRKGNYFPISGVRATTVIGSLNAENAVIINPAEEEPSNFISFNRDIPVGIDANDRGKDNIEIFKLKDRADIKSPRSDKWNLMRMVSQIAALNAPNGMVNQKKIDEAKKIIQTAQRKRQPFSGMIRENIKKGLL